MVITQTPFRMSFFGGGTDFPGYFEERGGSVISTSFDKYCYVSVRHLPRFFEHKNQIVYTKIERTQTADEIVHPAVRNAMKFLKMDEILMNYDADLPARSGLGTSSAFAVGLLNAFHALKGEYADKEQLAKEAIFLERELCAESGGWQDQIAAAFGGFNRIDFSRDSFKVSPVIISDERKSRLNKSLLLFFTGFSRFSAKIASQQEKATKDKTAQLDEMKDLVDEAEKILVDKNRDLSEFGKLLDRAWKLKREMTNEISSNSINEIYETGIKAGALGGKLLGAGGGGFILFYADEDRAESVKDALKSLLHVPFNFEDAGAKILYYKPETFFRSER